jgi:SAM-dependent methyltransferase
MAEYLTLSNADANWAAFDPDAYFEHYYGEPHSDDDIVARLSATALRDFAAGRTDLSILDVGTGANLIPLLAALPVAQTLTAWEYAQSNIVWLAAELQRGVLRPQWQRFWLEIAQVYGATASDIDVQQRLKLCTQVQQGSIFDLPDAQWDAATMFFCAESITQEPTEFAKACSVFAKSVRPGGALVAAFLARSAGYEVGGVAYPAVAIDQDVVADIFAPFAQKLHVETIGLTDSEVRSGYSGMIFLSAVTK